MCQQECSRTYSNQRVSGEVGTVRKEEVVISFGSFSRRKWGIQENFLWQGFEWRRVLSENTHLVLFVPCGLRLRKLPMSD